MEEAEKRQFVWLPTGEQEMLLKAALFNDRRAIAAWKQWRRSVRDVEILQAETRLFPLIYQNHLKLNYEDDFTPILKRSHRTAFRDAHIHLLNAEAAIKILNANGVRTLLLKGGALGVLYYGSPALRPMADIDLLIKPKDFFKSVEVVKAAGWIPQEKNLSLILQIINACDFKNFAGEQLDIHWRVMRDCWSADKNDLFWEAATKLEYNSLRTETICSTDHLFHVCCHGARQNALAPIRWVVDAMMILRSGDEIDWQRLYELGKFYRLSLTLSHALAYLKETFDAAIPDSYLRRVRELPITRMEILSF